MTQRVFDIENEYDMQDLWDILPDNVVRIYLEQIECFEFQRCMVDFSDKSKEFFTNYININWHDKTEITRPVYEITGQDIGKICCFWKEKEKIYGKLHHIEKGILGTKIYFINNYDSYPNCRRLSKQEIEELC